MDILKQFEGKINGTWKLGNLETFERVILLFTVPCTLLQVPLPVKKCPATNGPDA